MKEGTSAEKHLKHMKELTDQLATIGAPIAKEDQVVTLLGSLPKSYSTLFTALEARGDGISLNYVQQALVHEEQKLHGLRYSNNLDVHRGDTALVGDLKESIQTSKTSYLLWMWSFSTTLRKGQHTKQKLLVRRSKKRTLIESLHMLYAVAVMAQRLSMTIKFIYQTILATGMCREQHMSSAGTWDDLLYAVVQLHCTHGMCAL